MKNAKHDLAVAIIFFNRPDSLGEVFEAVRAARPSKLFLIQDGAREGNQNDIENISRCREIVENVDWECDVRKIYSDKNLGCGMNIYSGIKKAFEEVESLVILEDDIVVNDDFFSLCEELLEKYKDDERIHGITGMNHCGETTRCPNSYFFSEIGSCWGWATWKRCWDKMEFSEDFLEDSYSVECFLNLNRRTKRQRNGIIKASRQKRATLLSGGRLSGWAHQFMTTQYMNSALWIVPQKNLISNIGLTSESTHAAGSLKRIPKGLQCVFFAERGALPKPFVHPKYVIEDTKYAREVLAIMGEGFFRTLWRKIETIIRLILFSSFAEKKKALKKKFH